MLDPEALYRRGREAEAAGESDAALAAYRQLLGLRPDFANASLRLGMLLHQQGELAEAEIAYRRELAARPDFWACRANLAQLLSEREAAAELALAEAETALEACPLPAAQADLLLLIGKLLRRQGRPREALVRLESAEALQNSASLQGELARCRLQLGDSGAALRHYRSTLSLEPGFALHYEAAEFMVGLQRYPEAIGQFESLLARPQPIQALRAALIQGQIANAWQELNLPDQALKAYDSALAQAAHPALSLGRALVLPVVYDRLDQVAFWRQRMLSRLESLDPVLPAGFDPLELNVLPFYAAYQGYDDRPLMEALAKVYRRCLPDLEQGAYDLRRGPRRKVVVVSHFLYAHSVMHCFEALLLCLAQAPFELHLVAASNFVEDAVTARLRRAAASWTRLQGNLAHQLGQIRALAPELLIYTDMGLDPHSYILANYRLAPRQLLLPGQPVTSGLPSLDGFVSDRRSEPAGAQAHYSESLLLLDDLPSIYSLPPGSESHVPTLPSPMGRARLDLPAQRRLYLCPAQAFKLHPAMDEAFARILALDPQAQLLLLDLTPNGLIAHALHRLQRRLGEAAARVRVLPRQQPDRFRDLLCQVDVVLETFPFASYNTLMSAFAVAAPVVTLASDYLRGRYCLGLYRQMGIAGPVANSIQAYAELAVDLASQPARRLALQREIAAARPRIFDNHSVGEELREVLLDWLE